MFTETIPGRLAKALGRDIKLIFLLRKPVKRAFSHYRMAVRQFREYVSFEKAFELEPERMQSVDSIRVGSSYMGRGYYAQQIKNF